MKSELSSVDVHILAKELDTLLKGKVFDKFFQTSARTLKVKLRQVKSDLIIAPNYVCVSDFERVSPQSPTSFAMQLRKHLKGGVIESVRQHSFDRIILFSVRTKERHYTLIAELFSKGNIFLLDADMKILGLLEWQKWRDRILGVRQTYEFPPEQVNPLKLNPKQLSQIILKSDKTVAATLARDLNLGGTYAEEVCQIARLDKSRSASKLGDAEISALGDALADFRKHIKDSPKPELVKKEGVTVDIIPVLVEKYDKYETEPVESFNKAVDEYFSRQDIEKAKKTIASGASEKLKKLEKMRCEQEKAVKELQEKAVSCKSKGDLIYQNLNTIESLIGQIKKARDAGLTDKQIMKKFEEGKIKGVKEARLVESLKKDKLILKL